ncbi:hypothetical protein HK105_202842 [Polyrhizophydium stewartii]|uniref:Uncharacterized protein n=1 Tax=Polyrhizophydium stewartii TaxID=2732419 RepID=A0ABR4NDF0_9FUNG
MTPPAAWACSVCRGSFQSHRFECRECGHSECSFCVDDSRPAIVNAAGQRARRVGDSFYCGLPGSLPLAPPGFADMHPHLLLTSKGGRCSVCAKQLLQFEPTKACKPCSFVACAPCYNAKAGERSVRSRNAASTPGPQDGFMDYASGAIDLASSGLSAAGGFGAIKEAGKKVGDLFGQLAK